MGPVYVVGRAQARRLGKLVQVRLNVKAPARAAVPDDGRARRAVARVPYTAPGWSKNLAWRYRRSTGRHYLTPAARQARAGLAKAIALDAGQRPWPSKKTYLEIIVRRADMRGDPINVLDGVADAVAKAIGVDDRYAAIRRLDWALIDKKSPETPSIVVIVSQEGQ